MLASARIGDAALDPAIWPEIIQEICTVVGAKGAALLQTDVRTPDIPRSAEVEEIFKNYFAQGWHVQDIRANRSVPLLLRGEKVITDQDILTADEMRHAKLYRDFLPTIGLQWFAAIGFRAGSALWGLAIQRTPQEGAFERRDKLVLAQLVPRLTETATLSTLVGRVALTGMTHALDLIHQPALALDRLGFVLDVNAAAEEIFDDEIWVANRRLIIGNSRARAEYDTFLDRLRATPDTFVLTADPLVIRREAKPPILIRVYPIGGPARGPFMGARVLLVIQDLARKPLATRDDLQKAFGLSPAEARLAAQIAAGISIEKAAEILGIARETARNQLKSVFAKTDTHRQSELVALLSKI